MNRRERRERRGSRHPRRCPRRHPFRSRGRTWHRPAVLPVYQL